MNTEILVALITVSGSLLGIGMKAYFDFKKSQSSNISYNNKPKLTTHVVFSRITMYINHIQNTFSIVNKGKEEVFKCLLTMKLNIGYKYLLELANTLDEKLEEESTLNDYYIYNLFKENLNKNLEDMSTFYVNNDNFTKQEQECLRIVSKKFEKWHLSRIQYVMENMYMVCCSSLFYKDAYTKAVTLFDIYAATYAALLNDAQLTLESLNGDLHGLKFKGHIL